MSLARSLRCMVVPFLVWGTLSMLNSQPSIAAGGAPPPVSPASTRPPFAPALYTLRATGQQGSSLVFLDAEGKETIVATDPRKPKGRGAFGKGDAHATHFGPFNCTPDGSKVIYTLFGKPDKWGSDSGSGNSQMPGFSSMSELQRAFSYREVLEVSSAGAYAERAFEGVWVWDRATGKSQRLWDLYALEEIGKKWKLTSDTAPRPLHEELEMNTPMYLFHLKDEKFLWITASWFMVIDLKDRSCRPIDACDKDAYANLTESCMHAWQESDGTVRAFRGSRSYRISPEGRGRRENLDEAHWCNYVLQGDSGFVLADGKKLKFLTRNEKGELKEKMTVPSSLTELSLLEDGQTLLGHSATGFRSKSEFVFFAKKLTRKNNLFGTYSHTFQRLASDGKPAWTLELKDLGSPFFHLLQKGNRALMLVRRNADPKGVHRISVDLATGKVEQDEAWEGEDRQAFPEMDEMGFCIPAKQGQLVWLPSSAELDEKVPSAGWLASGTSGQVPDLKTSGIWMWVDSELRSQLLWSRPLADEMVVITQGRPTPLSLWANNGITLARGIWSFGTGDTSGSTSRSLTACERTLPFPKQALDRLVSSQLTDFANRWQENLKPSTVTTKVDAPEGPVASR
jgi:hypothetical protein